MHSPGLGNTGIKAVCEPNHISDEEVEAAKSPESLSECTPSPQERRAYHKEAEQVTRGRPGPEDQFGGLGHYAEIRTVAFPEQHFL